MNRQCNKTALHIGRENRVKKSREIVSEYLNTIRNLAPIEIDADRDPDTGLEVLPGYVDLGERV